MVQIREYKSSDAKGISKFMKRCFLQDVTTEVRSHDAEYYAWKYGKSPWGENVSLVAEDKGNIVGLFCIMPKKIKIGDDTLLIGETGDAYTDPEYQGKGILFKMISLAFNEMKKQNITSFYTTANEIALKIWTGLFRFEKMFEYRSYIRPLHYTSLIRKKFKLGFLSSILAWPLFLFDFCIFPEIWIRTRGVRLEEVKSDDRRFDTLWKTVGKSYPFTTVKDTVYMKYRFGSSSESYDLYILSEAHDIQGYVIVKMVNMLGLRCGLIVDWMVHKNKNDHFKKLLSLTLNMLRHRGCDLAGTWAISTTTHGKILKRYGFLKRKKTVHLVMGGEIQKCKNFNNLFDRSSWSFTHGDSDNV